MTLSWEKIKCALIASPRLQPERSLLLLMGLKEVFRSTETRRPPPPPASLFLSPLFRSSSGELGVVGGRESPST